MCILFHTAICGLGLCLGLEHFGLGLGLATDGLGLGLDTAGLGLGTAGLDYKSDKNSLHLYALLIIPFLTLVPSFAYSFRHSFLCLVLFYFIWSFIPSYICYFIHSILLIIVRSSHAG